MQLQTLAYTASPEDQACDHQTHLHRLNPKSAAGAWLAINSLRRASARQRSPFSFIGWRALSRCNSGCHAISREDQHAVELMPGNYTAIGNSTSSFCLLPGSSPWKICQAHQDVLLLQMLSHSVIAKAGGCPVPVDSPAILGGFLAAEPHLQDVFLQEVPFAMPAFKVSYCQGSLRFHLDAAEAGRQGQSCLRLMASQFHIACINEPSHIIAAARLTWSCLRIIPSAGR